MTMRLHNFFRSSTSTRLRVALNLKGLDYEYVAYALRKGENRTAAYLESQFKAIGLAPGNPDGTYTQKVPLVGITVTNAPTLTFAKGGTTRALKWRDDYVAWTKHVEPTASLDKSELVFVGYGTEAPEYQWDDFKGLDVAGKTLVMLVNDWSLRNLIPSSLRRASASISRSPRRRFRPWR